MRNQKGFHAVEIVLVVVVVLALGGLIAWRVLTPTTTSTMQTPQTRINSASDTQKASQSLDDASFDTGLDATTLDEDINSIL